MKHRQTLKNIVVMAMVDGSLNAHELELLSARCAKWGLDEGELRDAISHALSDDAAITLPTDEASREPFLSELLQMMAADGALVEAEKRLFALIAARLGYDREQLESLITRLTSGDRK